MSQELVDYFSARPDGSPFLLAHEIERTLHDVFNRSEWLLPAPYKIFFADEAAAPVLGFPVSDSIALRELDGRLEKWIGEEILWLLRRSDSNKGLHQALDSYAQQAIKLAENAMLSSLLADYHAVFWLAHSFDLARQFSQIPRRIGAFDATLARSQGDAIKYRIYARWASEMREQMERLSRRLNVVLDGEEERGLLFFRLMADCGLIFTEEFIGPDLRELRSFVTGQQQENFARFLELFDRYRALATQLIERDRTTASAVRLYAPSCDRPQLALLIDRRFQQFLLEHPSCSGSLDAHERQQIAWYSKKLIEFAILHQLRRGVEWMTMTAGGDIVPVDRNSQLVYSKATRPVDFGRPGVVDPMVYRFGLIYDITSFSETLGAIVRSGKKGEVNAYRQMLLFQSRLLAIIDRHKLQFEKFLGDGAFYTTRRALRLVHAAVEIQRFYSGMRSRGFAFNKGIRLALNHGYYRLLPMKASRQATDRAMEFYGPGIVELSRLTTGKANKEIEELQSFLLAHGYDQGQVQQFFAPLARESGMLDPSMHQREFYAYINSNGHLINEGIVGSLALLEQLALELTEEGQRLFRLPAKWATCIGFKVGLAGVDFIGIRMLGNVALKGMDKVEVAEFVAFASGEIEAEALSAPPSDLVLLLRQELHRDSEARAALEEEMRMREPDEEHDVFA